MLVSSGLTDPHESRIKNALKDFLVTHIRMQLRQFPNWVNRCTPHFFLGSGPRSSLVVSLSGFSWGLECSGLGFDSHLTGQ